jgi:ribonucleotide reductase alpha subunit
MRIERHFTSKKGGPYEGLRFVERNSEIRNPDGNARQVFHRLAGTWTYWGDKFGYFDSREDAKTFYDELSYMLASQMAAPNSPQWFNTGLHWAYGIDGPARGITTSTRRPASSRRRQRLRASAAARLLHPERGRRPGERRRHHGSVDP